MVSSPGDVTELLLELRAGNPAAEAKLIPVVYEQLHRLAAHYMRHERPDHTLQPTALVNEAYLRLTAQPKIDWKGHAHFFGVAARVMRQIVMEYARAHGAKKRGAFSPERSRELIALDEALKNLEQRSPRQGRVVELQF